MKSHQGFTMIEVMIVVALVALLSSFAIPSYRDYVTRGKIPDATSHLSTFRVRMEQYFQDNIRYSTVAGGTVCGVAMPTSDFFNYTCVATNTTYTITASGPGNKDASMVSFGYTINQSNSQTTTSAPSGWAAATMPASCWITKRGGSC